MVDEKYFTTVKPHNGIIYISPTFLDVRFLRTRPVTVNRFALSPDFALSLIFRQALFLVVFGNQAITDEDAYTLAMGGSTGAGCSTGYYGTHSEANTLAVTFCSYSSPIYLVV